MRCVPNRLGRVAVAVLLLAAVSSAAIQRGPVEARVTAATAAPPQSTMTTAPQPTTAANPYSLSLRCSANVGPTNSSFFMNGQRGVPAPGYGHNAYNYAEDAFFVVSHNSSNPVKNSGVAAILPGRNCSVVWTFEASAPITQSPMVDGVAVVFQTWDESTKVATAYSVNATSGKLLWSEQFSGIAHEGVINTAVHNGRVIIATLTNTTHASDSGKLQYTLSARYAEWGEFLWQWTAVTSYDSGVPEAITPFTKLWMTYNTISNRGFAGLGGSHVVCFNGEDGGLIWNYYLAYNMPFHSNSSGLTSTSGAATSGDFYCPTGTFSTVGLLYVVLANHDQGMYNVSVINQCDGTVIRTPDGEVGASFASASPIQGPPSISPSSNTVCVTSGGNVGGYVLPSERSMGCFNGSAAGDGQPGWAVGAGANGAGFGGLPTVGFTQPNNYVLSGVLESEMTGKLRVELRNRISGDLAYPAQVLVLSDTAELVAVGAPKTYESGWDVAFVGVGKANTSGAFAVYYVGN